MRNRHTREQAIAILEELSFNANFWDSEFHGTALPTTEELWDALLSFERLYQIVETIPKPAYLPSESGLKKTDVGDLYEKIFKKKWIPEMQGNLHLHSFHGAVAQFNAAILKMNYMHDTPAVARKFGAKLPKKITRRYHRYTFTPPNSKNTVAIEETNTYPESVEILHNTLFQTYFASRELLNTELPADAVESIFAYRNRQTQLISRTGKTCKEAASYFDGLLEKHQKMIIVSLSLNRCESDPTKDFDQAWLSSQWTKMMQNSRNSRPLSWLLGFMGAIRATEAKGLYLQVYFLFDAEQADPVGLADAVGSHWRNLTGGRYHRTPISSVKPSKFGSVVEISTKDKVLIDIMHKRVIPSLTKSRLYAVPTFLPPQNKTQLIDLDYNAAKIVKTQEKPNVDGASEATAKTAKSKKAKVDVPIFFRGQLSSESVVKSKALAKDDDL